MRISRVFVDLAFNVGETIALPETTRHYLLTVLRLKAGAQLCLFNGTGAEFSARLTQIQKKAAFVEIEAVSFPERESPLHLTLVQAIAKPDHMDLSIQKSVELGVTEIIPVITERSAPLDKKRSEKRQQHWQKIIYSACEQSGRCIPPILHPITTLTNYLARPHNGCCMVLAPTAQQRINTLPTDETHAQILIGAEGGLTQAEIETAHQAGFIDISLGARILRTETAAITMIGLCQARWGDL